MISNVIGGTIMKNQFKSLFSPLTVRGLTLPNRVVMMPMGSDLAGHDGQLTDEHIKWFFFL